MIEYFPPNSRAFGPFFIQIAQMGLSLPIWGLILPRIPSPTPVLYTAVTHPFWGYVRTQNTPSPPQNPPFLGLNLKVGKMNYRLGSLDPNWANNLKNGQNVSRSGQSSFMNIKARHEIPEFLNANLWSIHLIAFDIDWSWNNFTAHKFCSMLIEQLIDLENVRTDNLKLMTDLRDRFIDGWTVTQ